MSDLSFHVVVETNASGRGKYQSLHVRCLDCIPELNNSSVRSRCDFAYVSVLACVIKLTNPMSFVLPVFRVKSSEYLLLLDYEIWFSKLGIRINGL